VTIRTLLAISFVALTLPAPGPAQQPDNRPLPSIGSNRPKSEKDTNTRTIEGVVRDASDNPIKDAIVQLKDTKTAKIVNFSTKSDGRFAFRELAMDINYELVAKLGETATPVRKITVFDTRKDVVVNFQLPPAKPPQ